ncbi:MAG: hypothetical protein ABIK31_04445 [candidate division WOR-3 bacterium]
MPPSLLNIEKEQLKEEMNKSLNVLSEINPIESLKKETVDSIYELSFLKIFLAWERFIERTFILYLRGEQTDNGYKPTSYVSPKDENHAYDIIKGGFRYPDWLNLEFIREKADLFFDKGLPFKDVLYNNTTIKKVLQQMKKIRNRIVHASQNSIREYEELLRDEFGAVLNISPGEFLAKKYEDENISYIDYYKQILELASDKLIQ